MRENIFLNSVLLRMRGAEIRQRFEEIVEFAELAEFIDAPLRTYSSGMAARLGFAVATASEPNILLLDEVLSVGDEAFQEKCLQRLQRFTAAGTTMVLVTHDANLVREWCTRAAWISDKHVAAEGDPGMVVEAYHDFLKIGSDERRWA